MKKGKTSQLKGYENAKCSYGTVDAKELKSLYMRKYSKILEALKEKLENLKPADLNVKVS